MRVNPQISLAFDGRCQAALKHYERCLGGVTRFLLTWAESPIASEAPADWGDKVMHAAMEFGDVVIVAGDVPPDRFQPPQGFEIILNIDKTDDAVRAFEAMAEGGEVILPLQQTFWASRYGVLIDPFGIRWSVNCAAEAPPAS